MAIKDPLKIKQWKDLFIVCRGKETFYNDKREFITHATIPKAIKWIKENLGEDAVDEGFILFQ